MAPLDNQILQLAGAMTLAPRGRWFGSGVWSKPVTAIGLVAVALFIWVI